MSKDFETLKKEAHRRGIFPGARIACARNGAAGTVGDYGHWKAQGPHLIVGTDHNHDTLYAYDNGRKKWGTVITPAPSQGLQEGDAVECGTEIMKEAILEEARRRGLDVGENCGSFHTYPNVHYGWGDSPGMHGLVARQYWTRPWRALSVPEFLSRLENTKPPVPVIKIMDREVEFHDYGIRFGDHRVDRTTVLDIAQRMDGKEPVRKPDWKSLSGNTAYFPSAALAKAAHSRILELGAHCKWHMGERGSTRYLYFNASDGNLNGGSSVRSDLKLIPYGAFMDAIEALVPRVEDIVIDGHIVKFESDHIIVGCQRIPKQTVRDIAERLKK